MTEVFQDRIDEVSAHGVAGVEGNAKLIIVIYLIGEIDEFNIQYSAAAFLHFLCDGSSVFQKLSLDVGHQFCQSVFLSFPAEMHLTYFFHINDFCMEATSAPMYVSLLIC